MPTTTALDGGTQSIELDDGARLTAPGIVGTAGTRAPGRVTRRARGPDATGVPLAPALNAALRTQGVQEVRTVTVHASAVSAPDMRARPRQTRGGGPTAGSVGTLTFDVPPPRPGTEQVVLAVDQDGAVSWHLPNAIGAVPTGGARRTRRSVGDGGTQRFTIGSRFVMPDQASGAVPPNARARRGVVGAAGRMVLSTLVYPVTDPVVGAVGEHFARHWEERNRPYGVRRFTPAHYAEAGAEPMTDDAWRMLARGRSLLFIHGTFSTAHGAFGTLPSATMRALHTRYGGRVFAANVFTLSADPVENARWILAQLPRGASLDVDIVCHSRGGLVARALAEQGAALESGRSLRVGRVVFVAVPNAGTQLADPDHMVAMIDRFTSVLNIAPTGPVTETLEAIVTAVKVIGHGALGSLTGLAAMNPQGEFLRRMNHSSAGAATEHFAIAADYTPPDGGGLFHLVAERAGNAVVDRVFGEAPNDLVVPTRGVSANNGGAGFPFPDASCFAFAASRGVMHTQYFGCPETSERLLAWLTGAAMQERIPPVRATRAGTSKATSVEHAPPVGRTRRRTPPSEPSVYGAFPPGNGGAAGPLGDTESSARLDVSDQRELSQRRMKRGAPAVTAQLHPSAPTIPSRQGVRSTRAAGARRGAPAPRPTPTSRTESVSPRSASKRASKGQRVMGSARPTRERMTIQRFPSITSPHSATPGHAFDVVVDLQEQADAKTESNGVAIHNLAPDWKSERIGVQVRSTALIFADGGDAGEGEISVSRDGPSTPCTLSAHVRSDAMPDVDGNIVVDATFYHAGRYSGSARRAFPLVRKGTRGTTVKRADRAVAHAAAATNGARAHGAGAHLSTQGAAVIDLGASAPKLTVVIYPPDMNGTMQWRLNINESNRVPGLPELRSGPCSVGRDPAAFAAGLYAQADRVLPGQHRTFFNGIGEQLFEATPSCFKQAYWALRAEYERDFAIQFVTGEPYIPWEFMRPVDRTANRAADLLCLDHPVGRWLSDFEGAMPSRVPAGRVVTVAPDYTKRDDPNVPLLDAAQDEADMLVTDFAAQRVKPATHDQVLKVLQDSEGRQRVAVLHFAGHGKFDPGAANGSYLLLSDGDLRVSDVRSVDTQLGRRFATFVVFNACEVGQGTRVLDRIGGWAEAFLHERFSGFVAPLWPAYDEDARVVMQEFFEGAMQQRRPIGEVMRDIRTKHAGESPTFLSYVYYGDVLGCFA